MTGPKNSVWAIVIDKFLLYTRTRKSMDRFEEAFWSGGDLTAIPSAIV